MKNYGATPRRLAIAMALLATLALVALASAQPPARGAGDRPAAAARAGGEGSGAGWRGGLAGRLARQLDLNDAQREAVAKIESDGRARDLPLRKELRRLNHDLQGEMMKDAPSEKAVTALAAKIGELRVKLQTGRLLDRLAVREVLTPEQRDQLLAIGERGGRPGPRGGRGGRGGFGRHGGPGGHGWHGWHGGPQGGPVGACDGTRPGPGGRFPGCPGPFGPGAAQGTPDDED